ncbi:MAG: phosphomannomutase [Verrucomicrobiota bacterium]
MLLNIQELMVRSGVAFGTSGARGVATAMTDSVCYAYTRGFLQYLEAAGELKRGATGPVAVGGDFRSSTDRVMEAVCRAVADMGYEAVHCGKIPSPAVALFGFARAMPSIMITGSHIPEDRNGIKFNKAAGEVLKDDERGMSSQVIEIEDTLFGADGNFAKSNLAPRRIWGEAGDDYIARYLNFFEHDALSGWRVGVYQHSAVGRDVLLKILSGLGAEVTPLGRSEKFIPVDTEAIRSEDVQLAADWARLGKFNALVSTDGDSDRPLVSDEKGHWLRGDIAGILCAKFLEADSISTPVSCNTAVEKCGWFKEVHRTRIGSPYVVASMMQASAAGAKRVVGYEANGGFLLNSEIESDFGRGEKRLSALPTRDAVIVILSVLLKAKSEGTTISGLAAGLPARVTASDRIKNFATEKSAAILAKFNSGSESADTLEIERIFGGICGRVARLNRLDGLRIIFANEEVIHLRPSGNAPEFRCYAEADTEKRAREIVAGAFAQIQA